MITSQTRNVLLAICLAGLVACAGQDKVSLEEEQAMAFEAFRLATLDTVSDEQRAQEAAALVDELARISAEAREDQLSFRQAFRQLNRDHGASREQFVDLFEAFNVDIEMNQRHALAARKALAELLTREEWEALARLRKDALQSGTQAL